MWQRPDRRLTLPPELMQVGDCFVVNYNNKNYEIEVREAKPGNAISVVETDCQVGIDRAL